MRPPIRNHNWKHCCSGSRVGCPPPAKTRHYSNLARSHLINVVATPLLWGAHAPSRARFGAAAEPLPRYLVVIGEAPMIAREARALPNQLCLAIIAVVLCSVIGARAQEPMPTLQTIGQPGVTIEEVIVTGSNIPTAEEVTPQPVYILNRDEIFKLGVRSATDLVQKLPTVSGPSINENVNTLGNGQTEIDLRGLGPKETLVLQDGRRLAPNGFARYTVELNSFFGGAVDLNMFPIGLIDHIDVLEAGASAIYGADAVAGVFNVWLIHRFQNHAEVYVSYGNTNLGASNDQAEELAYVLGGVGDDKTDIVLYAEWYNRAAIYRRDRDVTSNADFTRLGGTDDRSGDFAGRVGDFV